MSLRLTVSRRAEWLIAELSGDLDARGDTSPLVPTPLLVPNRLVDAYVRFGLARRRGIAANLVTASIEGFAAGLFERAKAPRRALDARRLEGAILSLLLDEDALAGEVLEPVQDYLRAAGSEAEAADRRRVQLARELADRFAGYGDRPEMLEAWGKGRAVQRLPPFAATERWQAELWRALFAAGGTLDRLAAAEGCRRLPLGQLIGAADLSGLGAPAVLHVLGYTYLTALERRVLEAFARVARVEVHTTALWPGAAPPDPGAAELPSATELWGRPAAESFHALVSGTGAAIREAREERAAPCSLLERIQRELLLPRHERPGHDRSADDSLRLLRCPGIRREIEAVAGEIWRFVLGEGVASGAGPSTRSPVRWNEIAVLYPETEAEVYLTHLRAVFASHHEIPFTVADLPLTAASRVAQAVGLLLDLPLGRCTRAEVLRAALHPCVTARFERLAPDAETERWAGWCEALGIVHGRDHGDHRGTYIERDVLNWDQGLRRLALGAFLSGPRSPGLPGAAATPALHVGADSYLPHEVAQSELTAAGAFIGFFRSLLADARRAREARLAPMAWARFLASYLTAYVAPANDHEERELVRCVRAVQAIEDRGLEEREISYFIVRELVAEAIGGLGRSEGQPLADGVLVAPLRPMRALPFRAVFLLGMGEGKFPARDSRDALDLRQAERRAGDASARDLERQLFFELLLAARERLTISWVARDPLTGDVLEPAAPVVELQHLLKEELCVKLPPPSLEPLRRYEAGAQGERAPGQPAPFPAARREAEAAALGRSLRAWGNGSVPLSSLQELRAALEPGVAARLARKLGCFEVGGSSRAHPSPEIAGPVHLNLSTLRKFLECPLQGAARAVLGLRDDDEDDGREREEEPFATDRIVAVPLLRESFLGAARTGAPLLEAYRGAAERAERSGRMPTGLFATVEREAHVGLLERWRDRLAREGDLATLRRVRLGAADEFEDVDEVLPALAFAVRAPWAGAGEEVPIGVEIVGSTDPQIVTTDGHRGSVALIARAGGACDEPLRRRKDGLRAFLDHLVLTASGFPAGPHASVQVLGDDATKLDARSYLFHPLAQAAARGYLEALLADLFGRVHDYLLPCEAVFAHELRGTGIEDAVDALRESDRARYSSKYGPVPFPERYPTPGVEEAQAMIDRRFGLYFELWPEPAAGDERGGGDRASEEAAG